MHMFDGLVHIIDELRSGYGRLWDKEQTHESSKICPANESQEVYDAINSQDMENLCKELGDILFQVMLHSQIAKGEEAFIVDDVVNGIYRKMIRRHPYVFGGAKVNSVEEGLVLWNVTKKQKKAEKP